MTKKKFKCSQCRKPLNRDGAGWNWTTDAMIVAICKSCYRLNFAAEFPNAPRRFTPPREPRVDVD